MRHNICIRLVIMACVLHLSSLMNAAATDLCDGDTLYKFFKIKKTWDSAREECEFLGGRLAFINSESTHEKIRSHLNSVGNLMNSAGKGYWFGLNDIDNEGTYTFVGTGGIELTYDAGWSSERGRQQPNNSMKKDPNGQDCVQLWEQPPSPQTPKWNFDDAYCSNKKGYICEIQNSGCGGGGNLG
ncbi:salivary C-type lectin 1-like [Saccoglossus kowalevskii]|uniref:Perlucin-like protein-like n=1 Tax=Saccoglossus kowalevskii TaxID=10224 RepID=A0ABM0MFZ6_SACKO|nr:PREDICTED: perlucin-like protein-like [Saccoglossus kowalevskii]